MQPASCAIARMQQSVRRAGIVPIVRGGFGLDDVLAIGDAMLAAPVPLLEVTLNTPNAYAALEALRTRCGAELAIGAGTVRTAAQVQRALDAGAQFLVAPNLDPESVALARARDSLLLPGVFTATEEHTAFQAGCSMVKLFPCPDAAYLKALRAPLNDMEFVPTGGVDADNVGSYRRAGAAAVGIGSALIGAGRVDQADLIARARVLMRNWIQAAE